MAVLDFPANPTLGQTYDYPPYTYVYDGEKWNTTTGSGGGSGGGTSSQTYVGETAPAEATPGSTWFCTANGLMYILYDDGDTTQWIEANPNYPSAIGTLTAADVGAVAITGDTMSAPLKVKFGISEADFSADGMKTFDDTGALRWNLYKDPSNHDMILARYNSAGTWQGMSIVVSTTTGIVSAPDFTVTSDRRLKTNLAPLTDALDKVCKLSGFEYDKAIEIDGRPSRREVGLIADMVEDVLPLAVNTVGPNNIKTISPSAVIALLVEAVKDLRKEVEELKHGRT